MIETFICPLCQNESWTCLVHADRPFGHDDCRVEGVPCQVCHPLGNYPGIPDDAVILAERPPNGELHGDD